MDKIIVSPSEVRGLGNIVSPRTSSDYGLCEGKIVSKTEEVDNVSSTVLELSYLGSLSSNITLSGNRWIDYDESMESFSISATLRNSTSSTGSVLKSASLTCTVNDDLVLTGTTNTSGKCNFTIPVVDNGATRYNIQVKYEGASNRSGCIAYMTVNLGELSRILLHTTKSLISPNDNCSLVCQAFGSNNYGEIGLANKDIDFIEQSQVLFKDKGVTNEKNTNWTNYSDRLAITVDDNGTLLESNTSTNGYYLLNNSAVIYSKWTLEFDVVEYNQSVAVYIQGGSSLNSQINFPDYDVVNGSHVIVTYADKTFNVNVDGVDKEPFTHDKNFDLHEIGFRLNSYSVDKGRYLKYKNLKLTNDEVIDTVNTNGDGTAVLPLISQGFGERKILAKCGEYSSEVCTIMDAVYKDNQVNYGTANLVQTIEEDGTLLSTKNNSYGLFTLSQTANANTRIYIAPPYTIEFDLIDYNGAFYIRNDTSTGTIVTVVSSVNFDSLDLPHFGHVKIVNNGKLVQTFLNDELIRTVNFNNLPRCLTFRIENGSTFKFANLFYY